MTEEIMVEAGGVDTETTIPPSSMIQQMTNKRCWVEDSFIAPKKICHHFNLKDVEDPLSCSTEVFKPSIKNNENKENQMKKSEVITFEHQPLPSLYELGQMRHNKEPENEKNTEDQDSEDDPEDEGSMFDPPSCTMGLPYKHGLIYNDRFWLGNFNSNPPCPSHNTAVIPSPTSPPSPPISTYQFLDQSNQRIECDENGKSYLQLGTVNHPNLPVSPVIQPKQTILANRRPYPYHQPMNPTPGIRTPYDLTSCVAHHSSHCYKQQRSKMLNISLHKLHMARQRVDSSILRSVLICNMLRYIEESDQELREQEPSYNELSQDNQPPSQPSCNQNTQNILPGASSPPNIYQDNINLLKEPPDAPLKDFNSVFRQTPTPFLNEMGHSIEEERGINWSSVLSLSSQSHLDPLNNNSFNDALASGSNELVNVDLLQPRFDDIDWKLTPVTADDVLKAFPNNESLFICSP